MHCTYRTLVVLIALNAASFIRADEPTDWPPLKWKDAAPSPFARVESPMAVVDGKTIWFAGGFKGRHPGPVTAEVWKLVGGTYMLFQGLPMPAGYELDQLEARLLFRQLHLAARGPPNREDR